jgi:hypothetical protein
MVQARLVLSNYPEKSDAGGVVASAGGFSEMIRWRRVSVACSAQAAAQRGAIMAAAGNTSDGQ